MIGTARRRRGGALGGGPGSRRAPDDEDVVRMVVPTTGGGSSPISIAGGPFRPLRGDAVRSAQRRLPEPILAAWPSVRSGFTRRAEPQSWRNRSARAARGRPCGCGSRASGRASGWARRRPRTAPRRVGTRPRGGPGTAEAGAFLVGRSAHARAGPWRSLRPRPDFVRGRATSSSRLSDGPRGNESPPPDAGARNSRDDRGRARAEKPRSVGRHRAAAAALLPLVDDA